MLADGADDGRVGRFLDAVWKKEKLSTAEVHAIMNVCMAATYDPDPKAPLGFRLPFHLETGEFLAARWKRWQQHDPIRLVGKYARNLKTLKGIYVDCGWRDQYHIHYGTRILSLRLAEAGIRHQVRGIRRQSLGCRLQDGREPAVSLHGAEALTGYIGARVARAGARGEPRCAGVIFAGATTSKTGPPRIPAAGSREEDSRRRRHPAGAAARSSSL
jgi:hypothetical protein